MKIGVDIDDVVADFVNPLLKFFEKETGRITLYEDVFSYKFEEVWKISRDEAIAVVRNFYRSKEFDTLAIIDGALSALERLSQKHEIVFVTSRHNEAKLKTPDWLTRNFPFLNARVIYAGEYQHSDNEKVTKAGICLREGIGVIIEDNAGYALDCARNGVKSYLIERPWNRDSENHENMLKVKRWAEILEDIEK